MKRKIGAVLIALVLGIGGAAVASPAYADEVPPVDTPAAVVPEETPTEVIEEPATPDTTSIITPEETEVLPEALVANDVTEMAAIEEQVKKDYGYGVALWKADNDGGDPLWPQTLVAYTPTAGPDLHYYDEKANGECGWFQADVYSDDEVTAALIAGGKLFGPSNPAESWPGGQYQSQYSRQWFETSGCAVTPQFPTYVCGPNGPPEPADTLSIDYTLAYNAQLNSWRIKAVAIAPYTLASGQDKDVMVYEYVACPPDGPNHKVWGKSWCGGAKVVLKNPSQGDSDGGQTTASFVIWVDGNFYGAYAVMEDQQEVVHFTFTEDSGLHDIKVEAGSAQGGATLLELNDIESDCIPPQPEDYSTYTEWTDGEFECNDTTVEQTRTRTDFTFTLVEGEWVAQQVGDPVVEHQTRNLEKDEQFACPIPTTPGESLALTGQSPAGIITIAGGLLLAGAALTVLRMRRKVAEQG